MSLGRCSLHGCAFTVRLVEGVRDEYCPECEIDRLHQRCIRLAATAMHWCKEADDANPDVGMGPSDSRLFERTMYVAGIAILPGDRLNKARVLTEFRRLRHTQE